MKTLVWGVAPILRCIFPPRCTGLHSVSVTEDYASTSTTPSPMIRLDESTSLGRTATAKARTRQNIKRQTSNISALGYSNATKQLRRYHETCGTRQNKHRNKNAGIETADVDTSRNQFGKKNRTRVMTRRALTTTRKQFRSGSGSSLRELGIPKLEPCQSTKMPFRQPLTYC